MKLVLCRSQTINSNDVLEMPGGSHVDPGELPRTATLPKPKFRPTLIVLIMIARGVSATTLRELCKENMAYYSQVLEAARHASGCTARSWVESEYTCRLGRFCWGLGWDV